jgi:hypothetical protein
MNDPDFSVPDPLDEFDSQWQDFVDPPAMPRHSVAICPCCDQGLCGVRILELPDGSIEGLIVCDECEAIWRDPTLASKPTYPDPVVAYWPQRSVELWGNLTRWANLHDIESLGWLDAINRQLDQPPPGSDL